METALFDDLVQSLKEAQGIARGELAPSRRFERHPLDVKAMRERIGLSQPRFRCAQTGDSVSAFVNPPVSCDQEQDVLSCVLSFERL